VDDLPFVDRFINPAEIKNSKNLHKKNKKEQKHILKALT
jgi:hypothetical protein